MRAGDERAPARHPALLALRAEWTKLRTVAGPAWLLLGAVVATAGLSIAAAASQRCLAAGCTLDPAKVSLTGLYLGQAVVAVLGVLVIGGEYSTGMIRVSLTAMPRRVTILAAKAAVLAGPVLLASLLAVGGSVLAGRLTLPGRGFTAAHGYPAVLSLAQGPYLRAACGAVLYLTLVALLSLGVASVVRDPAAATGLVLGLLYLFPVIASLVSNPRLHRHLMQIGPATAGLTITATTHLKALPLTPWQGLGVLTLWSAGALLLGGTLLRLRDA